MKNIIVENMREFTQRNNLTEVNLLAIETTVPMDIYFKGSVKNTKLISLCESLMQGKLDSIPKKISERFIYACLCENDENGYLKLKLRIGYIPTVKGSTIKRLVKKVIPNFSDDSWDFELAESSSRVASKNSDASSWNMFLNEPKVNHLKLTKQFFS